MDKGVMTCPEHMHARVDVNVSQVSVRLEEHKAYGIL